MSLGISAVRNVLPQPVRLATSVAGAAAKVVPAPDKVAQAMLSKLTDGFDSKSIQSATSSSTSAAPTNSTEPAKKKKKKKHGLFHKLGGLLKKALPLVKNLAGMIPGLGQLIQPLEMAGSLISGQK
ncbi:MAG: hypothetical protein ACJ790_04150 [Myxococcaceae bacterium]